MAHKLKAIREQVAFAETKRPYPFKNHDLDDKVYLLDVIDKLSVDAGVMQVALQAIVDKKYRESKPTDIMWSNIDDTWVIAKNALREIGDKNNKE